MTEEEKSGMSELMRRISAGDSRARETLAEKYYHIIYCFIYKIMKSQQDAEDIAQETFLRICRHDFSVKTWTNGYVYIFQIAKNLCLDRFRRKKRREGLLIPQDELEIAGAAELDRNIEDFGFLSEILTPSEEKLILLKYNYGYTIQEVSERTGIPKRTLERQYSAIRDKIKKEEEAQK